MPSLLRDLDPKGVAREACDAFLSHLGRLTFLLNPLSVMLPSTDSMVDGTDFGLTVQQLAAFAKHGCPAGDWDHPEMGADALLMVVSALYGGALDRPTSLPGILEEGEPSSGLEVVLLASWTRVQISRMESVEPRQIACLGSVPLRTVQHHIAERQLAAEGSRPARVSAEAAVTYLKDRGVRF